MYSYYSYHHRLWLSLVLAILTTTAMCCCFANELDISESNDIINHDSHHHLEAQAAAAATLKDITEGSAADVSELHRSLRFEPTHLDFGVWSVGTAQSHTVTLVNQNRNRSIYLSSVSSVRTPAFYSSLSNRLLVPPNGNATFDVIFLPREQGAVSAILHIHTTFGGDTHIYTHKLTVRGEGRECPYRLQPLVGIRAPLNATLMPMIHMYNPHEKALQILEIYSSGGQFQLELPSGDPEAPQGLWEIPPYTTKPIIRIRFQGFTAGNHSAYIRIKIAEPKNNADENDDVDEDANDTSSSTTSNSIEQVLVIPVEFEILPEYGLYAVNPILEFGYLVIDEETPKPFKQTFLLRHSKSQLDINNRGKMKIESITYIKGVWMAGDGNEFTSISIDPEDIHESVTRLNEKLEIVLKETAGKSTETSSAAAAYTYHNLELIVRANIFRGSLHYDANSTLFLNDKTTSTAASDAAVDDVEDNVTAIMDQKEFEKDRHIMLRNDFQIPLTIYNITTPHNDSSKLSLHLETFESGLVLLPGLSLDLLVAFRLAKKQQLQQEDLKDLTRNYKTAIYVYTNITNFEIPIVISSTRMFVSTQTLSIWRSNNSVYTKELQLSSIPLREISHKGYIILQNRNSIPIKLNKWDFQKAPGIYYNAMFLGCIRASAINKSNDFTVDLDRSDYKFSSKLHEGDIAVFVVDLQPYTTELNTAYLRISTSYENITIAIKFTIVMGKLEVDQEKLHFANCFPGKLCSSELNIRSTFKQAIHMKYINFTDSGLTFEDKTTHGSKITPQAVTTVGRIFFEPSILCGSRCYIPSYTDEATTFPASKKLETALNIPHFDEVELRRRTELYRHFKYYFQNLDFTMTTKEMQHFQLNLMIEIQWPQLVTGRQMLPTTEVNKTQIYEVKISNPSDTPILIDYSLADPTLAKQTQISLPLEVIILTPSCYLTDKAVFSLVNAAPKKPILIPALSSIRLPIKFQANSMGSFCTLLHIRNNLTLYEGIWISAKAVQSQFRLGNRKPGSQTPLLFEITEQQLNAGCSVKTEGRDKKQTQPQVTSRRVFTARNSGELPIWIDSFWIDNQPCKGYGFKINDCKSFELKANSSKTIEITFQSDFTATRVSKTLTLKTNLSYAVNYMLVAQLPVKGLEQCTSLLIRPAWEHKIRNATIIMLMITFVLVLIAAHIDYGNIMFNQSTLYEAREKGQIHATFNLRNIAMRTTSQNNNESLTAASETELSQKNRGGLRKRNLSKKQSNGEASNSLSSTPNTMTFSEMVSWTFGTKTTKKSYKSNKVKEQQQPTMPASAASTATLAPTELKNSKSKLNEMKSLVDKMDEDLKKSQACKKLNKTNEKQMPLKPTVVAAAVEEQKIAKEDLEEKDAIKKEKIVSTTKLSTTKAASNAEPIASSLKAKEQRKSMELPLNLPQVEAVPSLATTPPPSTATLAYRNNAIGITPMTEITNQQMPLAKDLANGRKLGKTPGRERRKQAAQNTSPTTSSCSSASTSSSSCSSNHNPAAMANKRYERKPKNKATNSLKFSPNSHNMMNSFYSPAAAAAAAANDKNDQTFHPDVLSPWDCGQISFSDVLQQTQQFANSQMAAMNSSPTNLSNNDLMQQHSASMFEAMPPQSSASPQHLSNFVGAFENSEITAALTPKRPQKPTANDLGPIGSRKSPSSTPLWEPLNSAIMQLPRPLNNTTSATTSAAASLPYDLATLTNNFAFNDVRAARQNSAQQMSSASSTPPVQTQHDFDIVAKLQAIKAHHDIMRLRQLEQHLLQQQQYLNYTQAINNNWTPQQQQHLMNPTPAWTPFVGNSGVPCNPADVFSQAAPTSSASAAWGLNPGSSVATTSTSGLIPAPAGMQHHFAPHHHQQQQLASPSISASNTSDMVSASTVSFDNGMAHGAHVANGGLHAEHNNVADNMPMFNLFGGLSSIWNDNWKQSTQQQQQLQQQLEQQQQEQQQQQQQKPSQNPE